MISPNGIRSRKDHRGRDIEVNNDTDTDTDTDTDARKNHVVVPPNLTPLYSHGNTTTVMPWNDLQQMKQEANEVAMLVPIRHLFVQPIANANNNNTNHNHNHNNHHHHHPIITHEFSAVFDETDIDFVVPDDESQANANANANANSNWNHTATERKRSNSSRSRSRSLSQPPNPFVEYTTFSNSSLSSSSEGLFDASFPEITDNDNDNDNDPWANDNNNNNDNNPWANANDESQEYTIEHFRRLVMNQHDHFAVVVADDHGARAGVVSSSDDDDDDENNNNEVAKDDPIAVDPRVRVLHGEAFKNSSRPQQPLTLASVSASNSYSNHDLVVSDAPSGILLVFDRMLDCIDPHGASGSKYHRPRDFGSLDDDDDDTDTSSLWSQSLAMSRSSPVRELGANGGGGGSGSTTDDDCSLEVHPRGGSGSSSLSLSPRYNRYRYYYRHRPAAKRRSAHAVLPECEPIPLEELGDGFDCMFPCWEDDPETESTLAVTAAKSLRDLAASDVGRKRKGKGKGKWTGKKNLGGAVASAAAGAAVTTYHYTDAELNGELTTATVTTSLGSSEEEDDDDDSAAPRFRDFGEDDREALSLESSVLLELHRPVPVRAVTTSGSGSGRGSGDEVSSQSSLSELFDGLMVWSPPPYKAEDGNANNDGSDEEELDELVRILDRSTEETSTLSYSSCAS